VGTFTAGESSGHGMQDMRCLAIIAVLPGRTCIICALFCTFYAVVAATPGVIMTCDCDKSILIPM
jgi:hypothetical protein